MLDTKARLDFPGCFRVIECGRFFKMRLSIQAQCRWLDVELLQRGNTARLALDC